MSEQNLKELEADLPKGPLMVKMGNKVVPLDNYKSPHSQVIPGINTGGFIHEHRPQIKQPNPTMKRT